MELHLKSMPIWKWTIELVLGILLFFIIDGVAQTAFLIESQWLKSVAFIISGIAIIGLFQLWTRVFEKEWRMDTMSGLWKLFGGITVGALFFCAVTGILAAIGTYSASYAHPHWGMIMIFLCFYFLVSCTKKDRQPHLADINGISVSPSKLPTKRICRPHSSQRLLPPHRDAKNTLFFLNNVLFFLIICIYAKKVVPLRSILKNPNIINK